MSLPHAFPFRWLDQPAVVDGDGEVVCHAVLSAGASPTRHGVVSPILALEMIAQAAAASPADASPADASPADASPADRTESAPASAAPKPGLLAAIESASFDDVLARQPLMAGDTLRVTVRHGAAFGRLLKVHGSVQRQGVTLVKADLVLAVGG